MAKKAPKKKPASRPAARKRKDLLKSKNVDLPEKRMTGIVITPNGKRTKAQISFGEIVKVQMGSDNGEEVEIGEKQESIKVPEHTIKSPFMPHKDLISAVKSLTKHGLKMIGIEETDGEALAMGVKISGDMALKQSRATIILSIQSPFTEGIAKFPCPQITLYGDSEYPDNAALAKCVENVIDEATLYLGGKYGEVDDGQLSLFERFNFVVGGVQEKKRPVEQMEEVSEEA